MKRTLAYRVVDHLLQTLRQLSALSGIRLERAVLPINGPLQLVYTPPPPWEPLFYHPGSFVLEVNGLCSSPPIQVYPSRPNDQPPDPGFLRRQVDCVLVVAEHEGVRDIWDSLLQVTERFLEQSQARHREHVQRMEQAACALLSEHDLSSFLHLPEPGIQAQVRFHHQLQHRLYELTQTPPSLQVLAQLVATLACLRATSFKSPIIAIRGSRYILAKPSGQVETGEIYSPAVRPHFRLSLYWSLDGISEHLRYLRRTLTAFHGMAVDLDSAHRALLPVWNHDAHRLHGMLQSLIDPAQPEPFRCLVSEMSAHSKSGRGPLVIDTESEREHVVLLYHHAQMEPEVRHALDVGLSHYFTSLMNLSALFGNCSVQIRRIEPYRYLLEITPPGPYPDWEDRVQLIRSIGDDHGFTVEVVLKQ